MSMKKKAISGIAAAIMCLSAAIPCISASAAGVTNNDVIGKTLGEARPQLIAADRGDILMLKTCKYYYPIYPNYEIDESKYNEYCAAIGKTFADNRKTFDLDRDNKLDEAYRDNGDAPKYDRLWFTRNEQVAKQMRSRWTALYRIMGKAGIISKYAKPEYKTAFKKVEKAMASITITDHDSEFVLSYLLPRDFYHEAGREEDNIASFYYLGQIIGDINSDGKVTEKDATALNEYINGRKDLLTTMGGNNCAVECKDWIMDVNLDGKINTKDAQFIRYYAAIQMMKG